MEEQNNKDKRLANLKPFKPGQSGNPKGRPPRTKFISEMAYEELDKIPETVDGKPNTQKKTWRELIVTSFLNGAVKGSLLAELLDRIEGKVLSKLEIEGKLQSDIIFQIGKGYVSSPPETKLIEGEEKLNANKY